MDALLYMSDMISDTRELFYWSPFPNELLTSLRRLMNTTHFKDLSVDKRQAIIEIFRQTAPKVGKLINEFLGHASSKQSSRFGNDLVKEYRVKIENLFIGIWDNVNHYAEYQLLCYDKETEEGFLNLMDTIMSTNVENIENMLLEGADISNDKGTIISMDKSIALFHKKAFPAFVNMLQNEHERRHLFISEYMNELAEIPDRICFRIWQTQPWALALIGGLLSFKPMTRNIWDTVHRDVDKIIRPNNNFSTDHTGQILTYCYNDLPYSLQPCFLYCACYPVGFEIPATSLTQIWIAEGFVQKEDKQTSLETTANKYLDELVQRSLVFVSKRSLIGTIKSCRLHRSIHEFAIQQSYKEGFSVVNPNQEDVESVIRLAIYPDNKKQCTEVKNNHICSFSAFNFDRNILGSVMLLKVLALRNSTIPVTTLSNMIYLRYLSLRGSNISELPENIGDMKNLQTLDVRDTSIETLPESLWNIKTLRHVYVKPGTQIKGPPSEADIDNLHTRKQLRLMSRG